MELQNLEGKAFPGFGRCIYCGSDGGTHGLRDEHVVPFSLGGNTIIERASCRECESRTSYIDGYLANAILRQFRTLTRIQTRRPKKRPTSFITTIRIDGVVEDRTIPVTDHPLFLMMPILPVCGLLAGKSPASDFEGATVNLYFNSYADIKQRLGLQDNTSVQFKFDTTMNLPTFGRAIAKVGYGFAVLGLGLDGFRHLAVPDIVLGKYPFVPYFVGGDGALETPPPQHEGVAHTVSLGEVTQGRMRLLVADVRLFTYYGTERGLPVYRVVIGATRKHTPGVLDILEQGNYAQSGKVTFSFG
jgi:hypothetical protein